MKLRPLVAAVVTSLTWPAAGHAAMTMTEHNAEKERIEADFDVAAEECDECPSAAKDACLAEARMAFAREKVNTSEFRNSR